MRCKSSLVATDWILDYDEYYSDGRLGKVFLFRVAIIYFAKAFSILGPDLVLRHHKNVVFCAPLPNVTATLLNLSNLLSLDDS